MLQGRTALVTGGGGRLGRGIAAVLAREGAAVAIADRDPQRVADVVATLGAQGARAAGVVGDVSDPADAERLVAEANAALGQVDLLVNCAGIYPNCPLLEVSVEEWDRTFAINVRGTMLTCQALGRQWVQAEIRGSIVNVSSAAAQSARAGGAHYTGSKAAVNMLTEVLAIELGPHGIRVNAVAPGLVLDEVVSSEQPDLHPYVNQMLQATPMRRTGRPDDVAEAVAFLASERSAWTTGSILTVTGGSHCGRPHVPLTRDMEAGRVRERA
jgi:NAD(P)-dependent dehydrogenase (short-subunit alcohol dehydrogenase family)